MNGAGSALHGHTGMVFKMELSDLVVADWSIKCCGRMRQLPRPIQDFQALRALLPMALPTSELTAGLRRKGVLAVDATEGFLELTEERD